MKNTGFSRTPNGLYAEATLRDVNIIFNIEGKVNCTCPENLPDYIYYNAIIPLFFHGTYKILVRGSKPDLKKIINTLPPDNNKQFFFMDRDHDEIISIINHENYTFFTLGYSYENDFWTSKLIKTLLFALNPDELFADESIRKWKILEKQIAFIHKYNLLSRANGHTLFEFKGGCGILFSYEQKLNKFVINQECIDRFKHEWNSFNIQKTMKTRSANKNLQNKFYTHPGYLIQGHAYEYYILDVIGQLCDSTAILQQKGNIKNFFKNTALLYFKKSPKDYLSDSVIKHYKCIFDKINELR